MSVVRDLVQPEEQTSSHSVTTIWCRRPADDHSLCGCLAIAVRGSERQGGGALGALARVTRTDTHCLPGHNLQWIQRQGALDKIHATVAVC